MKQLVMNIQKYHDDIMSAHLSFVFIQGLSELMHLDDLYLKVILFAASNIIITFVVVNEPTCLLQ